MGHKQKGKNSNSPRNLRARAEAMLSAKPADTPTLPTQDVQALLHELNVHQMELEIQNEELRNSQEELAHARDRYVDLYEFAPVGYLMLDTDGTILEANLTATAMLGVERQDLTGMKLSKFVARQSQDDYYLSLQATFNGDTKQICEIEMRKADQTPLALRLESIAFGAGQEQRLRMALIDISAKKRAEQQLQQLNEQLKHQAYTDDLTGLPNRGFFMATYRKIIDHAKRHNRKVGLLLLDLNNFKQVNDDLGHAQGDHVLQVMASRLKEACRSGDILARLGGDEFILLVEDFKDTKDLIQIAQKLGASVNTPFERLGRNYQLSFSIGIATLHDSGITAETLLKAADDAMYQAKGEGRLYHMAKGNQT
jgi:diguanylate cyclase (GGDEF)-like protein/PAS domain S-box-containing protein